MKKKKKKDIFEPVF